MFFIFLGILHLEIDLKIIFLLLFGFFCICNVIISLAQRDKSMSAYTTVDSLYFAVLISCTYENHALVKEM